MKATNSSLSFPPPISAENYTRLPFDVVVAIVCMLSLLLCGRSILRGIILQAVSHWEVEGRKRGSGEKEEHPIWGSSIAQLV
jgi:hypothetical protein